MVLEFLEILILVSYKPVSYRKKKRVLDNKRKQSWSVDTIGKIQ